MFNFFKKKATKPIVKNKSSGAEVKYAPQTKIKYVDDLVDTLESEHKLLLTGYGNIIEAYENDKNDVLKKELLNFKGLLRGHLLKENTMLYVYLKHATKDDLFSNSLVSDMQREMGNIGNQVFRFISHWTQADVTEYNDKFYSDLQEIGGVLVSRIENEEANLYPIYANAI